MNVEEYLKKKSKSTSNVVENNYPRKLIKRTLIASICVFLILIVCNFSSSAKEYIEKYLFQTNFNFSKLNAVYKKYIGYIDDKILPVSKINSDYTSIEDYNDGAKILLNKETTINLLESGIVVFIGEKEGYGNTIIVQQSNGIDVWYGNIENIEVTLYSYIDKGTILGSALDEYYLVFQKNGEFLNYKDYIN